MSIKNKLDFAAFVKNKEVAPSLEYSTVLQATRTIIKKLKAQPRKETPFFLLLHYFKDEAKKPQYHFFSLGEHKKFQKYFLQIEMKPGNSKQRLSSSPKEVAIGTCEVQLVNGQPILYLYPNPKSKLPKSQWGKLTKLLKPYLMGLAIEVVFDRATKESSTLIAEEVPRSKEMDQPTTKAATTATNSNSKRFKQLEKINDYAHQVSTHVGLNKEEKLAANIQQLQKALQQVIKQAEADQVVSAEEQVAINKAQTMLHTAEEELKSYQRLQNGSLEEQEKAGFRANINKFRAKIDLLNSKINF